MIPPPALNDEESRLAAVKRYRLDGLGRETALDHATDLAAKIFGVPISLVSIVGAEEQCFRGAHGLGARSTPRDISFCGHVLAASRTLVVQDALEDERFWDNPLVTGDPQIRFYAGAPLMLKGGAMPGTLCVIDRQPRVFNPDEVEKLQQLATLVVDVIELRLDGIVAEERQQALSKMQDEFISTTSHELRTPLTSIAGSLRLLAAGAAGELPEKAKRLVDIACTNSVRLVGLVNDILDMDKLAAGEMQVDRIPLSLETIVNDAIQANEGFANAHGVRLVRGAVPFGLEVIGDAHRLQQVLTNLISNAVKYSDKEAEVVLSSTAVDEARARITVSDRGRGIPDEFRSRTFTRFAQADASDAREKGGTGLGLSIVKELVSRMGGEVSFDTELGVGTAFHVDLIKPN